MKSYLPLQEGYKKRQSRHAHRKPVLVMRLSTERPVAVSAVLHKVGTEKGNTRKDENEIGTAKNVAKDASSWRWYGCRKNGEDYQEEIVS